MILTSPITIQPWPLPGGNTGIVPPWLRPTEPITIQPWPLPGEPVDPVVEGARLLGRWG